VPIYEYECGKCGVFEHSQRMSDPVLAKCPTCRRKVRRLISNTSFQLKGTGWYVTDYARDGGKKGGKDGGKDGDAAKSESKSDTSSSSTGSESTSSKTEKSDTKAGASTPAKTAS
jgi:putative FmdB family regulatory protein